MESSVAWGYSSSAAMVWRKYALHAGSAPIVGVDFLEGGNEGRDDVGADVAVLVAVIAGEDVEGYGVVNVGEVNDYGVFDAGFRDVLKDRSSRSRWGSMRQKPRPLLGILLHKVFHEGAFAGAAFAEDVDAVGAVGFGEGNGAAEVNGGVRLTAEVKHSGEGGYGFIVALGQSD